MSGLDFSKSGSESAQAVLDVSYVSKVVSVGTSQTESKAGATRLPNRKELLMFNDGAVTVYFGPSGVTASGTTKGIPIAPGDLHAMNIGPNLPIYLIVASGTCNVVVQEIA